MQDLSSEQLFEALKGHFKKGLPFTSYRKPNKNLISTILNFDNNVVLLDDQTDAGFVFAPFNTENGIIYFANTNSEVLNTTDFVPKYNSRINKEKVDLNQKTGHENLVEKAIAYINKNELNKVVVSRCTNVHQENIDCFSIFNGMLEIYKEAFVYIWYHPKVGLWLGATPEKLIEVKGKNFKTVALAGTRVGDSKEIKWQNKELEEQQMVTTYLSDILEKYSSNLNVSGVQAVNAGRLQHLKTNISGRLNALNVNLKELILKLHPTPAVCGLPKEMAKNFILKNEDYDREFYTGFLGEYNFLNSDTRRTNTRNVENRAYFKVDLSTDLYVNLRCLQIKNETVKIYVGGGITKDSIPEKEWQETVEKTSTMKAVL